LITVLSRLRAIGTIACRAEHSTAGGQRGTDWKEAPNQAALAFNIVKAEPRHLPQQADDNGVTFPKEVVADAREVDPNTALRWATIAEEVQEFLQRVSPDADTWKWYRGHPKLNFVVLIPAAQRHAIIVKTHAKAPHQRHRR